MKKVPKHQELVTDENIANEIRDAIKESKEDIDSTNLQKSKFINELKMGLADEIKANSNTFKFIRKTRLQRLSINLKKFFTKF